MRLVTYTCWGDETWDYYKICWTNVATANRDAMRISMCIFVSKFSSNIYCLWGWWCCSAYESDNVDKLWSRCFRKESDNCVWAGVVLVKVNFEFLVLRKKLMTVVGECIMIFLVGFVWLCNFWFWNCDKWKPEWLLF